MGKSASGKDHIYSALRDDPELRLRPLVLYTTRPIREKETDGVQYHFVSAEALAAMEADGRVIERRDYDTVAGIWSYATVDDGTIDLCAHHYIAIGTIASFVRVRDHFGADKVIPILIETEDGERLLRAIKREKKQAVPNYEEVCRRFLADAEDFSEDHIKEAGIEHRFPNNALLPDCIDAVRRFCLSSMV